jgi:CheY-like chemotaxis protein
MILVVAHRPETRDALVPLIARTGHPVAAVDCGDEMLKRLRFQKPSLVILDCGIPASFDMLTNIRADRNARSTPVVMFSADDENLKQKALLQGADGYVPKGSLDWSELLTEIRRFADAGTRLE